MLDTRVHTELRRLSDTAASSARSDEAPTQQLDGLPWELVDVVLLSTHHHARLLPCITRNAPLSGAACTRQGLVLARYATQPGGAWAVTLAHSHMLLESVTRRNDSAFTTRSHAWCRPRPRPAASIRASWIGSSLNRAT